MISRRPCILLATVISTITTTRNEFMVISDEEFPSLMERLGFTFTSGSYHVMAKWIFVRRSKAHIITYLDAIYCTNSLRI